MNGCVWDNGKGNGVISGVYGKGMVGEGCVYGV